MTDQNKNIQAPLDCWRRIGIWGSESTRCEKLKFVKHCRNCEVFEQAARVSMAERQKKLETTEVSIETLIEKELLAGDISILPFRIRNKCIAIPSLSVITIADQVAIHSIPYNRNPMIKGLVAINHEVYTFISMTKLLNFGPRRINKNVKKLHSLYKRTLVMDLDGYSVGFYVDEVYPIHRYFEKNVKDEALNSSHSMLQGYLENAGDWCDDCQFFNISLASHQIKSVGK